MTKSGLLYSDLYLKHLTGVNHPESPERYRVVLEKLEEDGYSSKTKLLHPRAATAEEITLCHTPDYLELVEREIARGAPPLSTGDVTFCADSFEIAKQSAGGALVVADALMTGRIKNGFAVTRPPGHHATAAKGMGFCLFNNIAIAARYCQRHHGVDRVLIVDWDVHHGNGTQEIFYEDPSVFYFSTHQAPLYPGTGAAEERGAGDGTGATLNIPLPAGAGGEIVPLFRELLLPIMAEYKPEVVLISAGFDSHKLDPLGEFTLTEEDFGVLTDLVLSIEGAKVMSILEGGYHPEVLASCVTTHLDHLIAF
jgi:acetoin utilization deacetylase AcuC-like enzyme